MKFLYRFVFAVSCFCVPFSMGHSAFAQIKGQYTPKPQIAEEETLDPVVPRIFSSQVAEAKKAEKLDARLYSLSVLLFGFADIDNTYKERLFELLEPFKFEVTRRSTEFRRDLNNAKDAVTENYTKMNEYIDTYQTDFKTSLDGFSPEDRAIIEKVAESAHKDFILKSNKYFDLQAKFLKTYQKLVTFILERGGSYYYSSEYKNLSFYDASVRGMYAKLYDELKKINYEQTQLIKDMRAGAPI